MRDHAQAFEQAHSLRIDVAVQLLHEGQIGARVTRVGERPIGQDGGAGECGCAGHDQGYRVWLFLQLVTVSSVTGYMIRSHCNLYLLRLLQGT